MIVQPPPVFKVTDSDFPPVVWNTSTNMSARFSELRIGGRQMVVPSLAAPAASIANPAQQPANSNVSAAAPTAQIDWSKTA